jgi:tetratricopeptide (TPR) repeat protein
LQRRATRSGKRFESYHQALALLNLLPDSPERDDRELKLRQSVVRMLWVTRGSAAPETIDATERAAALAEKSGNLTQLVRSMTTRGFTAYFSGDLSTAGILADQALEIAVREGAPISLAVAHALQLITRHQRGDLAGAETHFTAGLKFFDDPRFRRLPDGLPGTFGNACRNAWMLGRADVACEREAQMMAAANGDNAYHMVQSAYYAALLRVLMGEYEQAEASAAQTLELSEKHQFPAIAAYSRCVLGRARGELGRASEGIELIRQGIASLLDVGNRAAISSCTTSLAAAQARDGAIVDALKTVEQALQTNPDELANRPETLRLRGELWLKQKHTNAAEANFREAIALAQKMSAKAWELRATMSLARVLNEQGKRGEASAMLAQIYSWFTEGFDTRDLKDAKALLDELSN